MFDLAQLLREKLGMGVNSKQVQGTSSGRQAQRAPVQLPLASEETALNPQLQGRVARPGTLQGNRQSSRDMLIRPQAQSRHHNKPFKMYEDQSFQGDPSAFRASHPGFKFYEDNSFSPPRPFNAVPQSPEQQLRFRLQMPQRPLFKKFEDGAMIMGNTSLPAHDSVNDFTGRQF